MGSHTLRGVLAISRQRGASECPSSRLLPLSDRGQLLITTQPPWATVEDELRALDPLLLLLGTEASSLLLHLRSRACVG
jgi:hypothetical protein